MSGNDQLPLSNTSTDGGQSVALRAISAEHGQEDDVTVADPFLEGTGAGTPAVRVPTASPTRSHPFPLREGTGERVIPGLSDITDDPFLRIGNGSGTGNRSGADEFSLSYKNASEVASTPPTPSAVNTVQTLRGGPEARPVPALQIKQQVHPPQPASSWQPVDLGQIVDGLADGSIEQPQPTVAGWLYAGAVNGLAGESGCGKTWTALVSSQIELMAGNAVVFVDLEDSPVGVAGRLLALGVPRDLILERFVYIRPDEAFRDDVRSLLWQVLEVMQPTLVVLDSTGESMALEGTDPNSDDGVARWFQRVARPIAERGPAVLLLDHLPKSDTAAASPIGSQRKRSAISGVQGIQTVAKGMSFAKGRAGIAKITVSKDRHGNFVKDEPALQLIVRPELSRGEVGVSASLTGIDSEEEFAPTRHMADICAWLAEQGAPQTTSAIKKAVKGKAETLNAALGVLVASGYVSVSTGSRNSSVYELLEVYRIGDAYEVPETAAPCSHEWHQSDKTCRRDWCHDGHFGSCNGDAGGSDISAVREPDSVVWEITGVAPAFIG